MRIFEITPPSCAALLILNACGTVGANAPGVRRHLLAGLHGRFGVGRAAAAERRLHRRGVHHLAAGLGGGAERHQVPQVARDVAEALGRALQPFARMHHRLTGVVGLLADPVADLLVPGPLLGRLQLRRRIGIVGR